MQVSKQFIPFFIGLTILAIGISFGFNCGFPINPARDLSPRLLAAVSGWGMSVFSNSNHWWVVPILATHIGALLGAWAYYLAIELHWQKDDTEDNDEEETDTEEADPLPDKKEYLNTEEPTTAPDIHFTIRQETLQDR